MKKRFKLIAVILFFISSCSREKEMIYINQLVKDLFCFKENSTWIYYDQVSATTDTMIVTNYEAHKMGMLKCKHNISYSEVIKMSVTFLQRIDVVFTPISNSRNNTADNTMFATQENPFPFTLICDENDNFDIYDGGSVKFMPIYQLNINEEYSNVYLFEYSNSKYYIAKYIGPIRMVKTGTFDYVLINKNIKQ
jgi:hypothetical protein